MVDILREAVSMKITPEHFELLRKSDVAHDIFMDLDIDEEDSVNLFSIFSALDIDKDGTIDLGELVDGIAKLRGEARRSDVLTIDFMVQALTSQCETSFEAVLKRLESIEQRVCGHR